jgi:hypothetical protein
MSLEPGVNPLELEKAIIMERRGRDIRPVVEVDRRREGSRPVR